MPATYASGLNELRSAYRQAANNVRRAAQRPTDRDVIRYESLQPEVFSMIEQEYGSDETMRYIREMETRRMMGGENGA
jgi:hypothetical protein